MPPTNCTTFKPCFPERINSRIIAMGDICVPMPCSPTTSPSRTICTACSRLITLFSFFAAIPPLLYGPSQTTCAAGPNVHWRLSFLLSLTSTLLVFLWSLLFEKHLAAVLENRHPLLPVLFFAAHVLLLQPRVLAD